MREIKFRAWDKITKKYFYSGTLDNGDVLVIHLDGEIEISSDDTYKPEDFTIEQFTGLRDKNGREIYEGDLCTITDPYNGATAGSARVIFSHEYDGGWVLTSDGNNRLNIGTRAQYVAVIGNIHENPELLP